MLRPLAISSVLLACVGCHMVPDIVHQPIVRNPFPQLSRVAVATFINQSNEKTVDGFQFANAYFAELQSLQGFEVVPPTVVEAAMLRYGITLDGPEDARRLAQLLDVDAVVVGVITEYTPYYPPRCGLKVSWYTANPCYHAIPPGYALPWGTPEEEFIPEPLVYEAEMALAREQLKTQVPKYDKMIEELPSPPAAPALQQIPTDAPSANEESSAYHQPMLPGPTTAPGQTTETIAPGRPVLPDNWPDRSGFTPEMPSPDVPDCEPYPGAVMSHTKIYRADDRTLIETLKNYYYLRDDDRGGGWQSYLRRSDDFIRFCCHMHITEMLTARGGGGQTRVVWR